MPFHRERVFKLSVFKLSAVAAPLRRSCSALMLAALAAAVAGAQPADVGVIEDGVIETVAGGGFFGDGGAATAAVLSYPSGVAPDGAGNLYIADTYNNRIRKVDAAGGITTVAGGGIPGYGVGDGGAAVEAVLNWPSGVALDDFGNLYIADTGNHRIRKVDAAGGITTVAGGDQKFGGFFGDGGAATAAVLNRPADVALDDFGNLYIADERNHRIRKVDAAGVITTVAGDGTSVYGGDGGPAAAAQLSYPNGVASDGLGNLYIADSGNARIRKVDAAGVITTVAGDGTSVYGGDGGDGGAATAAQLYFPNGVALDGAGNLYIADGGDRIRKVDAAGVITTVAGDGTRGFSGDGGAAVATQLNVPQGVAPDGAGNLYIADQHNHRIRKVDAAGVITTVAGNFFRDDGPAVAVHLYNPTGVALDGAGNLYIADTDGQRIRKVDAAGVITTVAGIGPTTAGFTTPGFSGDGGAAVAAQLNYPSGVAPDGAGNLYIADTRNHRIRKVDAAGVITTVAGDGTPGYGGDGGAAVAARLSSPTGVAPDAAGNLYIADSFNSRIRKVDAAGVITTVAGDGTFGYGGDGGAAVAAQLSGPEGVALDAAGNLYIADRSNNRIRKVDAGTGVITTVAGTGTQGYSGDGGPAVAAQLRDPAGVAPDASGNLYIADERNHRIRKVDAAGVITTVAGTGTPGYNGDGCGPLIGDLGGPRNVALDAAGNLYIADAINDRIRRVTFPSRISAGGIALATGTPVVRRISPNALISVFGQSFAPPGTLATIPTLNPAGRVAANLAATCLEIAGERVPLFAVFPHQINAQAPRGLTPGTARLDVIRGCGTPGERRSRKESVAVAPASPAFFNFASNPDGRNPVVALHGGGPALVGPPGAVAGAALTPAAPGEIVTLFGTGFGPTEPALEAGRIPGVQAPLAGEVSFYFGSVEPPLIETVAGDGTRGYGGDGGPAVAAPLNSPQSVALDAAGNLYIATGYRIRKVDAAGVISTVAGDGTWGYGGDGGPAVEAQLKGSRGMALDGAGNLYFADGYNQRIRKVDAATGVITTVAGDGTDGYGGDGGPATAAQLRGPSGVALDAAGNLYIADSENHRIRKVDAAGVITTVAGDGTDGYGGDGGGYGGDGGPATAAHLYYPRGVASDGLGNLYIADSENRRIRRVDAAGVITTVAGDGTTRSYGRDSGDGGPAVAAHLRFPVGVALDSVGNLYFAEATYGREYASYSETSRIRKVDLGGIISTVAGGWRSGYGGDGGPATAAQLYSPSDVALDGAGNLYIATGYRIRRVEARFKRNSHAAPLYAGAAPCCAGLYQFTVRLPDDLPDGNVSVIAVVQGVPTPPGPFLAIQRR